MVGHKATTVSKAASEVLECKAREGVAVNADQKDVLADEVLLVFKAWKRLAFKATKAKWARLDTKGTTDLWGRLGHRASDRKESKEKASLDHKVSRDPRDPLDRRALDRKGSRVRLVAPETKAVADREERKARARWDRKEPSATSDHRASSARKDPPKPARKEQLATLDRKECKAKDSKG